MVVILTSYYSDIYDTHATRISHTYYYNSIDKALKYDSETIAI